MKNENGQEKSAILKGQTLVNLLNVKTVLDNKSNVLNMGLKSNTKYIFIADTMNDNRNQFNGKYVYNDGTMANDFSLVKRADKGKVRNIFTTPDKGKEIVNMNVYYVDNTNNSPMSVDNMVIVEYQDGMENWDIPYFEGMQSVKNSQTLTNVLNYNAFATSSDYPYTYDGQYITNTKEVDYTPWRNMKSVSNIVKPNTNYLFMLYNPSDVEIRLESKFINTEESTTQNLVVPSGTKQSCKVLSSSDATGLYIKFYPTNNTTANTKLQIMIIEYKDGMENWDIPYFEGMQSVKLPVLTTTGKNLLPSLNYISPEDVLNLTKGNIRVKNGAIYSLTMNSLVSSTGLYRLGIMAFKNGENITKSNTITFTKGSLVFRDDVYKRYQTSGDSSKLIDLIFTVNDDVELYIALVKGTNTDVNSKAITQLEKGSVATSYEPYKSNILTVNEEVELRGIGDVQDELDLMTGEVVERIGEIVLDGSEEWSMTTREDWTSCRFNINKIFYTGTTDTIITNSKYVGGYSGTGGNTIRISNNAIYIFDETITSVNDFKNHLQSNPLTVQYKLETESIKTVDLTIKDQDNQPQERMKLFPNGYINTSSLTFPPILELKGITHNNKLSMTTTNGTNNTQLATLDNLALDGIICREGTVVRDSYDVESGLYTKRVFRFTIDEEFVERYRGKWGFNNSTTMTVAYITTTYPKCANANYGITNLLPFMYNTTTRACCVTTNTSNLYITLPKEEVLSQDVDGILEWIKRNGTIEVAYQMATPQIIHMQPNMTPYVSTRPYQGSIESQGNILESSFLDYTSEQSIISPKPLGEGDVLRWEQGSQCYVYENDKEYIPLTDYNQPMGTVLDLEEEDGEQFVENLDGGDIIVDVPFKEKAVYERHLTPYEDNVIYPTQDKLDPTGKIEVDYICGETWQNPNDLSDIRHLGELREDGQYDVTIRRSGDDEIRLLEGTTHIGLDGDGLNPSEFELTFFNSGGVEVGKYGDTSHTLEDCVVDSKLETGTVYGQTLVNLMTNCKDEYVVRYHDINNPNNIVANISMMKPNTEYTLFYKAKYRTEGDGSGIGGSLNIGTSIEQGFITTGQTYTTEYNQYIYKITTSSVVDCFVFASNGLYFAIKECVLLEGDYTSYPMSIPYFEGVGSTIVNGFSGCGKNLFDINFIDTIYSNFDDNTTVKIDNNSFTMTSGANKRSYLVQKKPIILKPNTVYRLSLTGYSTGDYRRINIGASEGVDKNDYQSITLDTNEATYSTRFTTNKSGHVYINFYPTTSAESLTTISNIQLEEGTVATTYEPYKGTTYTLPTPITLNKVGDIADTFDVVSGVETRNVTELTFNGSENWDAIFNSSSSVFKLTSPSIKANSPLLIKNGLVDGIIFIAFENNVLVIKTTTEFASTSVNRFKNKLKDNPITIYAQLANPQTIQHTLIPSTIQTTQEPTFILPQPLRSVPNGICDRLYWDENKGHYCIEKRIERFTIDESCSDVRHGGFSNSNYVEIYMPGIIKSIVDNQGYCEDPSYTMNGYNGNMYKNSINYKAFSIGMNKASLIVSRMELEQVIGTTYNNDYNQLRQYLGLKPVTILYPLATSEIIDLPHLNKKLTLPTQPNTLPIGYKVEYPKANPQLGLTIPYKQLNYPSRPQNIDFKMDIADYVLTWDDVKEARQYNVILNDRVIATVKEPQWNSGEEMYGYIMVEAQNELADNLSEELYIKTVPNAPAQLTVAHNPMTDYYDFEISFIKTSAIAEYYTVQYRIDGGEWVYKTIQSDEIDPNSKVLWRFSIYEINEQIEVWATATNEIGTNDILPVATYYMSPTPQWTYRINSKELFVRWMDDSPYDTQYKLRYQYKSDGIYRYAYFEGDKQEIGKLYEALIPLADDEEVSIALCIMSEKENLYTKPIRASKELDPNIKPPKNFNYHWLARGLIEFYWEDNYDVDVEYEAIVEHRLTSGNNEWITDTRIFSATDTEGTGTVYRLSYQLEDLEEIRVKVRMKWAMNETEWSESLTTVFIPVEGNPPQWIRRTQTQEGLLVEWEAQEYVDSYHVYVMSNGEELQHLETMDNFIYVDLDYSNTIDIEIYEATRFSGGIQSDPTDKMCFRPTMDKHQLIHDVVTPDTLTYEIEVDTVQRGIKERQVIHDINTTPKVTSKQPMDVSISSPFTLSFHPLQLDVHQAGSKYYGDTELHIKTLDVKSRDAIEVLTFERITDQYGVDFTVYTPSASKYPITLEVNRVRIVCFGDSLTSGHPGFWMVV